MVLLNFREMRFLLRVDRGWRRVCRQRQAEPEHRPVPQFAVYARSSAVIQHNVFHDCQTQAGPTRLSRASFVHSVEALK